MCCVEPTATTVSRRCWRGSLWGRLRNRHSDRLHRLPRRYQGRHPLKGGRTRRHRERVGALLQSLGIFVDSSSWGWKLAAGILCLIAAFQGGGWGVGVFSVLGILFGLFLVINPLMGVATLTFILAIFMLIGGVGAVVQAFRIRREAAQQGRRVR